MNLLPLWMRWRRPPHSQVLPPSRHRLPFALAAALALLTSGCASGMPDTMNPRAFPADQVAPWLPQGPGSMATVGPVAPTPEGPLPGANVETTAPATADAATPDTLTGPELPPEHPAARRDLWERLRQGLTVRDLDGPLVRQWERWYAERPDYVQRMTERGARYLFHIVDEVDRRGMPMELALLPFIESAFNPRALSTARASGIWQFMPATGRDFDLKQNLFRDDRRDVQASTRAALDYLQALHGMFGDWHLALAAYNWGQGNVQRSVVRNERARLPADYESLRMPEETRHYVPKLQAIENIVRDPARFGLQLPALENHPFFLSVRVERDIDASLAARLAGLSLDEFHALNPQLNKPVVLAAGTPELLLPYDNARQFVSARENHTGPLASWTAWVAPRNVRPAEAARLVGMSEERLREVNRIPAGMQIRQGSTLLVDRAPHVRADVPEKVADGATIQLSPETAGTRQRYIRVGKQPVSLAAMARRHGVDRGQLARWNDLPAEAMLQPGQRLVVMGAAAPSVKAKSSTRPPAATAKTRTAKARPVARPGGTSGPTSSSTRASGPRTSGPKASGRTPPPRPPSKGTASTSR